MKHTYLVTNQHLHLLSVVMLLAGIVTMVSVSVDTFAYGTHQGATIAPVFETSAGGPALIAGSLYPAAPTAQPMIVEKITLGTLLVFVGYAIHAMVHASDKKPRKKRRNQ